ncbi:MAG TPA: PQQ-binding-like beta-propeller repeat protein [Bryobacteraceae bacterium]|jgi:outer membrane protein assembly factor BamB|nr:PQQ-binding-like beta-propeller repeat protein [Bryobacteraceae bacterium]
MNFPAIFGAAASLLLAGLCPAQSMFRGNPAHTGVFPGEGPRQFHGVKWKFVTGDRVVSSPVWHDGTLYFGGDDGNVYAVDAASGKQNWKYLTNGPVPATPAVAAGLVYFPSYDGRFYAVDAKTGMLKWKFTTGGERRFEAKGIHGMQPQNQTIADPYDVFLSSPVVVNGSVYFGSGDGNLYALDAANGNLRWKFPTGDVVHASPAYDAGVIYVGSWDSNFYAVDAETGKEKWRFHGGEDPAIHNQVGFQSSPAVMDGVVYTGCRDSNLYALDAATGKEKWRVNNRGSWVIASPAVMGGKGGKVLFATSDSSLFQAVDAATGKLIYKQDTKAYVFSSPAVAGDLAYTGVLNGTLEARDLNTGAALWDFQTDESRQNRNWILTPERKFNTAMLYVSTWREAPIVSVDRQFAIGAFFSSPLIVNGVVYAASTDGYLYALQ